VRISKIIVVHASASRGSWRSAGPQPAAAFQQGIRDRHL